MSLITRIADLAIAIATDIKGLSATVSEFDQRVTDLEEAPPPAATVDIEALKPDLLQIIRDELLHWGIYRNEYAGTGWYKDQNGRVYGKDVPSGSTRVYEGDPNTYIVVYDADLVRSTLEALSASADRVVFVTSNLTKLYYTDERDGGKYTIASAQGKGGSDQQVKGDVTSWDVGHISNFDYAFRGERNLDGVSGLDFSNMISAVAAFEGTVFKAGQAVTSWDTSKLENAELMFASTQYVKTNIDTLAGFTSMDFSAVTNAKRMFKGIRIVYAINLSQWDWGSLVDASYMFEDGVFLEFNGAELWKVGNVTNMTGMFSNFTTYKYSDLSGWCVTNIPTAPSNFAPSSMPAALRPVWGSCPNGV